MASSSGAGGKPQFSSSLMRLKFMQKGAAKRSQPETDKDDKGKEETSQEAPVVDDSKWTATTFVAKGCRVVVERDPAPGARSGRMSFGKAPESSASQEQEAPAAAAAAAAAADKSRGTGKPEKHSSRDADQDALQPLRPPKRQRR